MFSFNFKNNIQFLRAISVILVFFYHLNLDIFQKGYLGVDIFFVISGYVITQSIFFNYYKKKKVEVISFFKKRILRIVPNLIFILSCTFLFYKFYGPSNISLGNDYITSLLGFSNLYYLFSNKGYFYNIFDNPFAHTWSLGVEEQFYIIYPILVYLILNNKNSLLTNIKKFLLLIAFLISISLIFSIYYVDKNSDFSFYFSPLRFWELGFGCLLFVIDKKITKNQLFTNLSFVILILVILINHETPYIINNILVVIFSGIFITTSKYDFFLNNNFTLKLGKISYSFYLWHLPIIFFVNIYFNNIILQLLLSFTLSFLLSYLTYSFIEKPFVLLYKNFNKIIIITTPIFFLFFGLIIYFLASENIYKTALRSFIIENNYLEKKYDWKKRVTFQSIFINDKEIHEHCDRFNLVKNEIELNQNCLKKFNNEYLVFVEGDSYTAQFINPLNENIDIKNLYFRFSPQNYISNNLLKKLTKEYKYVYYVRDINNLKTLKFIIDSDLSKIDNIRFIFFNSTPFINEKIHAQRCLSQQINCFLFKNLDYSDRNLKELNEELNKIKSEKVYLFDSYNTICPMEKCPIYDKNKDILYFMDNTHLSIEGSNALKKEIKFFFKNEIKINRLN